jgi:hypothetical protein
MGGERIEGSEMKHKFTLLVFLFVGGIIGYVLGYHIAETKAPLLAYAIRDGKGHTRQYISELEITNYWRLDIDYPSAKNGFILKEFPTETFLTDKHGLCIDLGSDNTNGLFDKLIVMWPTNDNDHYVTWTDEGLNGSWDLKGDSHGTQIRIGSDWYEIARTNGPYEFIKTEQGLKRYKLVGSEYQIVEKQ